MNNFLCTLNILIEKSGLKKKSIAEAMGLSYKQFSDLLCGRRVIRESDIPLICRALKTDPNTLFGWDNDAIKRSA